MRKPEPNTPCGYCFNNWAMVFDHLWPRSARGTDAAENLYPSCKRCNLLLSDKCFGTLREKREYVRQTLIARGQWNKFKIPIQGTGRARSRTKQKKKVILSYDYAAANKPPKRVHLNFWVTCDHYYCQKKFRPTQIHQRHCSAVCRRAKFSIVGALELGYPVKRKEVPVGANRNQRQPGA